MADKDFSFENPLKNKTGNVIVYKQNDKSKKPDNYGIHYENGSCFDRNGKLVIGCVEPGFEGGNSRRRRNKRSKKSRSNKKRKTFRKKRVHHK